jgi:hypothetical protein
LEIPEFLQSSIGIYSHWWGWKPWPCWRLSRRQSDLCALKG